MQWLDMHGGQLDFATKDLPGAFMSRLSHVYVISKCDVRLCGVAHDTHCHHGTVKHLMCVHAILGFLFPTFTLMWCWHHNTKRSVSLSKPQFILQNLAHAVFFKFYSNEWMVVCFIIWMGIGMLWIIYIGKRALFVAACLLWGFTMWLSVLHYFSISRTESVLIWFSMKRKLKFWQVKFYF